MAQTHNAPSDVLPLKPADFHILMVLLEGELHGYGVMQQVAEQSGGTVRLELGSLYRLIARMIDLGLIADAKRRRGDDRRRYYRVTPYGREVARSEARRLEVVVRTARAHDLLKDEPA
ncbi:MAG: helix-turn-helix transcriptional regulator [Gemmatimonadetes bacterium]|nr:helix-turn-helix transcriptional regulator [Gemmatimonadota bacterium]